LPDVPVQTDDRAVRLHYLPALASQCHYIPPSYALSNPRRPACRPRVKNRLLSYRDRWLAGHTPIAIGRFGLRRCTTNDALSDRGCRSQRCHIVSTKLTIRGRALPPICNLQSGILNDIVMPRFDIAP